MLDSDRRHLEARYRLIDLTSADECLDLLDLFYADLFVPCFPDADERESLDTLRSNLIKRQQGWYGKNNYHILLLIDGVQIVGASIFDYLAASNCGAIEYILVDENYRGQGIGRLAHEHSIALMQKDASRAGHSQMNAVMVEVNDPFQVPLSMDVVDPFDRVLMWEKWGYQRLKFPYEQPALSPEQSAIDYLLVGVKVVSTELLDCFPAKLAKTMVHDYLVWANRLSDIDQNVFYKRMCDYANTIEHVQLETFSGYIGRDKSLNIRPVTVPKGSDWELFTKCYNRHFPAGPTNVSVDTIAARIESGLPHQGLYHVWQLLDGGGIVTFSTLPGIGFLGYMALDKQYRGQGFARAACKRLEEQLIRDREDITHCYVECAPNSPQESAFKAVGYRPVPGIYRAPPLDAGADLLSQGPVMALMRKRLGDEILSAEVDGEELLCHMNMILGSIFGIAEPQLSASYQTLKISLGI